MKKKVAMKEFTAMKKAIWIKNWQMKSTRRGKSYVNITVCVYPIGHASTLSQVVKRKGPSTYSQVPHLTSTGRLVRFRFFLLRNLLRIICYMKINNNQ